MVTAASANNGTVTINDDGTLNYVPDDNYNGSDTITYTISDGEGGTDTATVGVTVTAVTDLTAGDDTESVDEDTTLNASVAGNDSTTSGGALTYAVTAGVSNGTLNFNADGSYDYTPNANYTGGDSFTYTVTDADSGESLTQTVTITVTSVDPIVTQSIVIDGSEINAGGQFATLATGSFTDWSKTGAVMSRDGETLTVNGEALSYVSVGEKLLAVTSSGIVAFEVSLSEENGITGYAVELKASIDAVVISSTDDNGAFSPSNEESKTVNFGSSLTVTASGFSESGISSTVNGNNAGFGVGGGGKQQGVDGSEILRFDVSDGEVPKSILGFTLSLVQLDEARGNNEATPVDGVWVAYSYNAETESYDEVATGELISGVNTIAPGVSFDRIELSAGEGGPFAVSDSLSEFAFELPATIDLQATVDGSAVDFSITFDQLSASDITMEAVDPDSLLLAGAGSETLVGLTGEADTFEWNLADGTTEGDTILGFEEEADAIDLSDLLTGYDSADDLTDFISVTTETVGGQTNTIISINSDGEGADTDQKIVVEGVDWVGSETDMASILNSLITSGKIIDPDTGG